MRTIIAGSRDFHDYAALESAIAASGFTISRVLSGAAAGVDAMGERYAAAHSIPVERHPADWKGRGRAAGPIRNQEMADAADALVAIHVGGSRGTADMIRRARARGLKVYVVTYPETR